MNKYVHFSLSLSDLLTTDTRGRSNRRVSSLSLFLSVFLMTESCCIMATTVYVKKRAGDQRLCLVLDIEATRTCVDRD